MRTSIQFTGTPEIMANLKRFNYKLEQAGIDAVNSGLRVLEDGMKQACPVNTDPDDTDTIHLRDSIRSAKGAVRYKNKIVGRVGPSKLTAMHVEFGTKNMFPRVFMRSQLYLHKNEIRMATRYILKRELGL